MKVKKKIVFGPKKQKVFHIAIHLQKANWKYSKTKFKGNKKKEDREFWESKKEKPRRWQSSRPQRKAEHNGLEHFPEYD